jgi:hypothetical protein
MIVSLGNLQVSSNLQIVRRNARMIHQDTIQEGQNAIHIAYTFCIFSVNHDGDSQSKGTTGAARAVQAGIKNQMPVFTKDKLSSKYKMFKRVLKDFRFFICHLRSVVKSASLKKSCYLQVPGWIPAENTSSQIHMDLSK